MRDEAAVYPCRDHMPQPLTVPSKELFAGRPVAATRPLHELLPIRVV